MKCDSPFYVTPKGHTQAVPVPCGRCPPCKIRRVDSWCFRLMQEEKRSTSAYFITLTYDNYSVPVTPNGWMTLKKSDFQDYMKRLRKLCPDQNLKYYAVGEYGSENLRPHFHAILFNVPDEKLIGNAWSLDGTQLGTVWIGSVSTDSIAYCMKYQDKQQALPLFKNWKPYVGRDDRLPEFPLMSKGLGSNYLTDAMVKYHRKDLTRLYVTREGGYKKALPKYYRDKIYTDFEKKCQVSIIQDMVLLEELQERRLFRGDYDAQKGAERYARHHKFYSRLKSRKL